MKKLKMWYIKLAFAALFFLLTAEVLSVSNIAGVSAEPVVPKVEASVVTNTKDISTVAIADAVSAANAAIAKNQVRLPAPTQLISVKGKSYNYNLVIPALKINVGVLGLGITDEGRMAVPNNYTEVGWYSLGYKPGEVGSAVMGAHVDNGGKINGVFKNLKTLKAGDDVYVADGDGNTYHYKVTARKVYSYKTPITDDVFLKKDTERLNLITCYGKWLPKENTYNQRLVVFAELVPATTLSAR